MMFSSVYCFYALNSGIEFIILQKKPIYYQKVIFFEIPTLQIIYIYLKVHIECLKWFLQKSL